MRRKFKAFVKLLAITLFSASAWAQVTIRPGDILVADAIASGGAGAVLRIDGRERAALDDERTQPATPVVGDARVHHDHGVSVVRMFGHDAGPGLRVAEDHPLGS